MRPRLSDRLYDLFCFMVLVRAGLAARLRCILEPMRCHGLERILPETGLDTIANNRGRLLRLLIDRPRRLDGGLINDQAAHRGEKQRDEAGQRQLRFVVF